ncbi:putative quinol monooxygenase [Blastococcus haudaquaticus]|uniref:Antibiotic biosynthesis monooxygenase n=1 Tax=Blastococcus haudaquaticus TaxID=1938745 RepID=A0A286GR76_9ACTN|nr:antibiotic biosynthesis monooxygenase family protein [Blastococcus haudaquaticus]SOD97464.1 Antibiotic biosynthesis monooxygenase [Blastococcus haudaquaticus]
MIVVAGELRVASVDRDRYLAAVAEVTAQARQAPGCLDFVQAADPLDPERIVVLERWESDEDLQRFRSSGDPDDAGPDLPEIVSADVRKYRISAVEEP